MKTIYLGCFSLFLVIGLSHVAPVQAQVLVSDQALTAAQPDCPADIDVVPPALKNTRVVTFGEAHGTEEIPRLVGDYVCALAKQEPRRPVVLALEFRSDEQPLADAYLASAGTPADVARLLAGYSWQTATGKTGALAGAQDGRTSRAGLALFERLRKLRAAGYRVSIVEFIETTDEPHDPADGPPDEDDSDRRHERAMAKIMLKALAAHPDAQFVVEGGGHVASRHDVLSSHRANYRPMGEILRRAGVDIVSLGAVYGPGSQTWQCYTPEGYEGPFVTEMITCGPHAIPATVPHATPVIRLDAYDGTYYVGTTHASLPAVSQ